MADTGVKAQMLNRVVRILECFTQERPELGVREISRLVSVPSSAIGRLMTAMKSMGILSQNPETKSYSIGPRVLTWAGTYLSTSDIRNIALPYLKDLHEATEETISLYILDGKERVCIERLESTRNVRFVAPRVGRHLPLHAGSAGKVMLAFLSEARQDEVINGGVLTALTEKTIVDPVELRREVQKIHSLGYAVSNGEWILDASGIAAPIFDRHGEVVGALTISGPTQRFTNEIVEGYIEPVVRVSRMISVGLGFYAETSKETGHL